MSTVEFRSHGLSTSAGKPRTVILPIESVFSWLDGGDALELVLPPHCGA